ncbi:MAG: cobalamin-dependent protein [Deltaproteobacteria bacterium]|nr:cobalamin-dependent protein [Deltaproteobacteria bacterium]
MNVLLISPNIETLPDPVFPLGLAYLAAALRENNIPCHILDLCFVADYESAIESAINAFKPDVIGLSLRNVDNVSYPNSISYLPFYQKVVKTIKRMCSTPVVLGGSGLALLPDQIMDYLEADYGIVGEGEFAFIELLKRLQAGDGANKGPPCKIFHSENGMAKDLDAIPLPDRSGFDNRLYLTKGGMGNIQTKRGCPFKCIYCTYPIIEGNQMRLRDPTRVCDEIERLLGYGVDTLFIVDSTFNYPIDHAQGVCREIIQRRLTIKWSCYANPRFVTPNLLDLMLKSGCTSVEFGTDSAHDAMLVNMGKNFTIRDLQHASKICRESGMAFCHSLLLGGPGETMATAQQTLDTVQGMLPTTAIVMIGTRIFPHTRLAEIALNEGMIDPNEDFLDPVFYISRAIQNEILSFIEGYSKQNPTWIFPGLNINMTERGQRTLRRFGIKGPLWEFMKRLDKREKN